MMVNPLLTISGLPFGAPAFDEVRREHYMPAFRGHGPQLGALLAKLGIVPENKSLNL